MQSSKFRVCERGLLALLVPSVPTGGVDQDWYEACQIEPDRNRAEKTRAELDVFFGGSR